MVIITWDEIEYETITRISGDGHGPDVPDIPLTSSDEDLVKAVLCGEDSWDVVGVARTSKTAIIEWRSCLGHLAITTIIWD